MEDFRDTEKKKKKVGFLRRFLIGWVILFSSDVFSFSSFEFVTEISLFSVQICLLISPVLSQQTGKKILKSVLETKVP